MAYGLTAAWDNDSPCGVVAPGDPVRAARRHAPLPLYRLLSDW